MMKLNNEFIKTKRLLSLIFRIMFKDPKIYLLSILIPVIISFILYWVWGTLSVNTIFSPQMLGFLSIGVIIIPFYISLLINEWKSTNFLKQLKVSGVSSINLLISITVITSFCTLISSISSLIFALISTKFFYAFPVNFNVFENIDWYIWIYYFLELIFMSILSLIIFVALSNLTNIKTLSIFINIAVLLILLLTSDLTILPMITSQSKFFSIVQYLNPLKYATWVIFMITSYQFLDYYGIHQILSTNNTSDLFISFSNIWIPLLMSIVFVALIIIYIKFKFIWEVKS